MTEVLVTEKLPGAMDAGTLSSPMKVTNNQVMDMKPYLHHLQSSATPQEANLHAPSDSQRFHGNGQSKSMSHPRADRRLVSVASSLRQHDLNNGL